MSVFQSIRDIFQTRAASATALHMPDRIEAPQGFAQIALRPVAEDDQAEWNDVRWSNREWLAPWESGDPMGGGLLSFHEWVLRLREGEASGTGAVFLIEYQMRIVGQISIGAISYGSLRTGMIGYWVARQWAGHGFAPLATAMLSDWAFSAPDGPRLHRIEIAILPENDRSKRVVSKLGFTYEGVRRRYMFIGGQWRDHETYSLLATDQPGSVTDRLR